MLRPWTVHAKAAIEKILKKFSLKNFPFQKYSEITTKIVEIFEYF